MSEQDKLVFATITECEACFTPDVCRLRGTCDYYDAQKVRVVAPPAPELPALPEPRQDEFDRMLSTLRYVIGAGQAPDGETARDHYNAIICSIANRVERTEAADVRAACETVKRAAIAADSAARVPLTDELRELEQAELRYRLTFPIAPHAWHPERSRAWDSLATAGDKARAVLAATQGNKP